MGKRKYKANRVGMPATVREYRTVTDLLTRDDVGAILKSLVADRENITQLVVIARRCDGSISWGGNAAAGDALLLMELVKGWMLDDG